MSDVITHEVFNQRTPRVDAKLFIGNRALQHALRANPAVFTAWGSGHGIDDAQGRRLARDTALVLQAALLRQHSTDAVFPAFCSSRLGDRSDVFGALPAGCDLSAIVERAQLH